MGPGGGKGCSPNGAKRTEAKHNFLTALAWRAKLAQTSALYPLQNYWYPPITRESMEFVKKPRAERAVPISAASVITGIEVHTLRYWEKEFAEFLSPVRTTGGQRRYGPEDIQTLFLIKRLLRDEMFSIAGARRHLSRHFEAVSAA